MKVWFHAASVGEVNALKPLINLFSSQGHSYILTAYTSSGARHASKLYPDSRVYKYPYVDNPFFVKKLIREEKPDLLIIAETELWPFLISESVKLGLKAYIVNGRISDKTFRTYYRFRWLFGKLLKKLSQIYTKSDKHRRRFLLLGARDAKFVGDLKVDAVMTPVEPIQRHQLGFSDEDILITFGSVRSKEFPHILSALRNMKGLYKFVIAPRHLANVPQLERKLREEGFTVTTRTNPRGGADIVILDTMGELRSIYSISDIAFVGGTLEDYGGHNILEPLFFGIPTIIGQFYWNVREEAHYFKRKKAIFVVEDWQELVETIKFIVKNPSINNHVREVSQEFFRIYGNASQKIYEDIIGTKER